MLGEHEELIPLDEVPRHLRTPRPLHKATPWRWALKGVGNRIIGDWWKKTFVRPIQSSHTHARRRATETLWANYPLPEDES